MYVERIQLINYGPIEHVDIVFPFDNGRPKPIVLVGDSGSGKSVLLSHIANGLILAHDVAFPESPEMEPGKVFKLRSNSYITAPHSFYFGKVDYVGDISVGEMRTNSAKQQGETTPPTIHEVVARDAWQRMPVGDNDYQFGPVKVAADKNRVANAVRTQCALYFPPNRFEEPAWLNEDNLNAKASYMDLKHTSGHTSRRVLNYSPMRDIQRWLFEVVYDRVAFELQTTRANIPVQQGSDRTSVPLSLFLGYRGQSTDTYQLSLDIVRRVVRSPGNVRFGIGPRHNRALSIMVDDQTLVPNIFQLASGELSLLSLFLSIVRDFDLSDENLTTSESIKGIVIVDEIEAHLSVDHQHEILPQMIKSFPNVQFVVTTHSPLFALGMEREFGVDGFRLYRMPEGHHISPEEFGEFERAYQVFTDTAAFSTDVLSAIKQSRKAIVFVDGATDVQYLRRAAELLGNSEMLDEIDLRPAGGDTKLKNIWNSARRLDPDLVPQKVVLLHDCDSDISAAREGNLTKHVVPRLFNNPVEKGIENLFSKPTLATAMAVKPAFVDVTPEHELIRRGKTITVPESWVVNEDEKSNLCDWLCANGDALDFANFHPVFDVLGSLLSEDTA